MMLDKLPRGQAVAFRHVVIPVEKFVFKYIKPIKYLRTYEDILQKK